MTVTVNPRLFLDMLKHIEEKQLPFAAAVSLSRLASEYREEAKRQLPTKFVIRTGWIAKGFRVKPASKYDLTSSVSQIDPFMAAQEVGGEKRSSTRRTVAVPVQEDTQGHPGARPTPESVTRQGKWPGAILRGKRGFIVQLRDGDELVLQRLRKKGRKRARTRDAVGRFVTIAGKRRKVATGPFALRTRGQRDPRVAVMYVLKKRVLIKPRWHFVEGAREYARENYGRIFLRAWAEANRPTQDASGVWARS